MSNFYKFITSNNSLWTGDGSLKSKYSAYSSPQSIGQIRTVWYEWAETATTAKFTADEAQPDNKSYINVYLVLNVNPATPTICELHKIRFEFDDTVATVNGITSWTKDWPTSPSQSLNGSWTTTSVGWNVSTKTIVDSDYTYNVATITFGIGPARYYGHRVNYPARNFADFVSTSASIRGYVGSYHERMNPRYIDGIGTITHLDYNTIDATNDPSFNEAFSGGVDPNTSRIFSSSWGSNASFVYIRVAATIKNVNTRFGFKEKAPTYMNAVDWSTGDILNSVKWPTDISSSLDNNGNAVENSWTQITAQRQAWAYSFDTGTVANNVINNGGLLDGISYNTIYLTQYSTAYVPPAFSPATAGSSAKLIELRNALDVFLGAGIPLEIYNVWYTTSQASGSESTTCWVYYAYRDAQSAIRYSTQEVSYNNGTNAWTVLAGVYAATKTSSVFDPTSPTYTALYVGMPPFEIDVSPTSLAALKSVYDASVYINANTTLSQVYNIWYNHEDTFNAAIPSPTTRTVDTWAYLLTDAPEDTSGNLIFETRRATYSIANTNASYEWTIPTDETITTTTHPDQISLGYSTSIDTGYASIPNSALYFLAYFHVNIYTLTRTNSIEQVIAQYSGINKLKSINEMWYDKSTVDADVYDASFNDTLLEVPEVSIKIYAAGTNGGVSIYNNYDISYNKNIRSWPSVIANEISIETITSGSAETWTYEQIYYNPFQDIASTITAIKATYNALYPTPGMDKITKLWDFARNNNAQTMLLFVSFLLNGSETIKYTTSVYNRIEDIWSIPNAEEEFNAGLSETVKYYEFIISELNGYATEIKALYNEKYAGINQIVEIHKLWYDETSVANSTINCLLFYSYQNENDAANKTHFAIIPIDYERYDVNENIEAYFAISAEASLTDVEYTYDNANVDFVELAEYTNTPTFVLSTVELEPIMISNPVIRGQFDASYNQITGNAVINIHTLWVENGVSISEDSITYSSPIIKALVYLSYATQLYETREVEYDLQLNEWIITTTSNPGNIRETGLTATDLTDYREIYTNLPIIPPFPRTTAVSDESLIKLETAYNTYSTGKIATAIQQMWYNTTTTYDEVVRCIVHMAYMQNSAVEYSIFDISYNTSLISTQPWLLSASNQTVSATQTTTNLPVLISLLGESIENYQSFYTIPVGTSIRGSRIRYFDNSVQTTAMPPIGTIIVWSGETLPIGYLWCDGASYNPNEALYNRLFSVVAYAYGREVVGAVARFNVPDLRSRFPIGYTNNLTSDTEHRAATRTGGNAQIKKSQFVHNHSVNTSEYYTGINKRQNADPGSNSDRYDTTALHNDTVTTENNTNESSTQFYPKFVVFRFILKYK
jgi:microcystin-dependent protein